MEGEDSFEAIVAKAVYEVNRNQLLCLSSLKSLLALATLSQRWMRCSGRHGNRLERQVKDLVVRSGLGQSINPGGIGGRPSDARFVWIVSAEPGGQINEDRARAEGADFLCTLK